MAQLELHEDLFALYRPERFHSWIYFVQQGGDDGPVKIGFTTQNPYQRLESLQTGNPEPLRLIAVLPGTMDGERHIHARLDPFRLRGEWFENPEVIRMYVENWIWGVLNADPEMREWARKVAVAIEGRKAARAEAAVARYRLKFEENPLPPQQCCCESPVGSDGRCFTCGKAIPEPF